MAGPSATSCVGTMLFLIFLFCGSSYATEGLRIGNSLNIFGRYGFLGVSMKVIGRPQPWLFREPTTTIFQNIEEYTSSWSENPEAVFNGQFHVEFCRDIVDLLQAYYREFKIEQAANPWKAFTASWSKEAIANSFGFDTTYINDEYAYVLVRVSRYIESKQLKDRDGANLLPLEFVKTLADQVKEGDFSSVGTFIRKIGSHFITAYATGDSLYQVLVYESSKFIRLKNKLETHGIGSLSKAALHFYFSPWYAVQVGSILSASGNSTVVDWANLHFRSSYSSFHYYSLIKLYRNDKLLKELDEKFENGAVISLQLKTLSSIFPDVVKRNWFNEVISNKLELWDNNMWLTF